MISRHRSLDFIVIDFPDWSFNQSETVLSISLQRKALASPITLNHFCKSSF